MQLISPLISLSAVWIIVVISPGPCFLSAVQQTTNGKIKNGIFTAVGIMFGTLIWCIGSIIGLATLFSTANWIYNIIRYLGSAYLVFLGVKTIIGSKHIVKAKNIVAKHFSIGDSIKIGFLTDIGNPKAAIFFCSMFASLLPMNSGPWFYGSAVFIIVVIEFSWYLLVACLFGQKQIIALYNRSKKWIDRFVGSIFIVLGIKLALSEK